MMKALTRRLRELVGREDLDREAQAELLQHVEMAAAAKIEAGLDPAEARRLARIELGTPEAALEEIRRERTGFHLDLFLKDLRLALRTLRRRPAFALTCVATIGLGVGATVALFAVVDAVVLRPLPLPDAQSLVAVYDTNPAKGIQRTGITSGNVRDWRERARGLEGVAGYYTMGRTLTVGVDSEPVLASQVTQGFFDLLRIQPAAGRIFTKEETDAALFNSAAAPVGTNLVAMISHGLWQRRFGFDPAVTTRTVMIDRKVFRIVGVTPPEFALPSPEVQVFLPWAIKPNAPRDQHYLSGIARLSSGVSMAQAADELKSVARTLGGEFPDTNAGWLPALVPLQDDIVGDSRKGLFLLLGAVGLVLLVACANVALLSLARGLERVHEASIRLALGASRGRLLLQGLLDALLVSAAGGALGAVVAGSAISLMKAAGTDVPRLQEVSMDPRALAFACLVSTAAALVSGIPTAWRQAQAVASPLLIGTPAVGGPRARRRLRDGLVVAEVALAVVLLAGASLLVRSYQVLSAVDPGFDPRGVLVAPVFLDMEGYGGGGRSRLYYQQLVERLEALPGVVSAGGATALPTSPLGPDFERPVWASEGPGDDAAKRQAWVRVITPRYFETLGMRVIDGRAFDDREAPDGAQTVVLGESVAKRLWPGRSAVGQRLVIDYSSAGTYPYEVVGVVNDVRFSGPRAAPREEIYLAHAQRPYLVMNVAVRTRGDARLLIPSVQKVLYDLDPRKPAQSLRPLEDLLGATYARDRRAMQTLSAFAIAAVLLALLGVHGMLSHHVREHRREIGVRVAMGATRRDVIAWVARRGLGLTLTGLAIGGVLAALLGPRLGDLLFGVRLGDPVTFVALAALPVIGFLVSLPPAIRAARMDPVEALRVG